MTTIEIHESVIGNFAHREDAEAVGLVLIEKGWPVMYSDNGLPEWHFSCLADYRRFGLDYERAVDALARSGVLKVKWDCDCKEAQEEPCPHGEDPVKDLATMEDAELAELWGYPLRQAIERRYPGLREWIEANVNCLYGALAFALQLEAKAGTTASGPLWLRRKWTKRHGGGLRTYDRQVQDFAEFVHALSEDAWFSEYLAKQRLGLEDLETCDVCHGLRYVDCRCEVNNEQDD